MQCDLPLTLGISTTIRTALDTAKLAIEDCSGIVNCLSLSARHLFLASTLRPALAHDRSIDETDQEEAARLHPIRGQTVLVQGELQEIRTLQSYHPDTKTTSISYAIPRPGSNTTVLGGCNIKDDWSTDVDKEMTTSILSRARKLVPELMIAAEEGEEARFDVIKAQVGLRPGRTGGARVGREVVSLSDGKGDELLVVHAYGMAGAGFQNSVGVASKVLRLVEEGKSS